MMSVLCSWLLFSTYVSAHLYCACEPGMRDGEGQGRGDYAGGTPVHSYSCTHAMVMVVANIVFASINVMFVTVNV